MQTIHFNDDLLDGYGTDPLIIKPERSYNNLVVTPPEKVHPKFLSDRIIRIHKTIGEDIDEMMGHLDCSEITITFKECWRKSLSNSEIHFMIKEFFCRVSTLDYSEMLLVTEYGKNSNMHFHGLIRAKAKRKSAIKSYCNKRFGRTTIGMIKYPESYKKYLLKEQTDIDMIKDILYFKADDEENIHTRTPREGDPRRGEGVLGEAPALRASPSNYRTRVASSTIK